MPLTIEDIDLEELLDLPLLCQSTHGQSPWRECVCAVTGTHLATTCVASKVVCTPLAIMIELIRPLALCATCGQRARTHWKVVPL